jgi:hypothetical protein
MDKLDELLTKSNTNPNNLKLFITGSPGIGMSYVSKQLFPPDQYTNEKPNTDDNFGTTIEKDAGPIGTEHTNICYHTWVWVPQLFWVTHSEIFGYHTTGESRVSS